LLPLASAAAKAVEHIEKERDDKYRQQPKRAELVACTGEHVDITSRCKQLCVVACSQQKRVYGYYSRQAWPHTSPCLSAIYTTQNTQGGPDIDGGRVTKINQQGAHDSSCQRLLALGPVSSSVYRTIKALICAGEHQIGTSPANRSGLYGIRITVKGQAVMQRLPACISAVKAVQPPCSGRP
jgi:hypothetical protein